MEQKAIKEEPKIIKEVHHWTSEEKIKWFGYGEWVEEADAVEFEYLGNRALVMRIVQREPFAVEETYFGGYLCGYVEIPKDHEAFGNREKAESFDCHGGVTFCECHEEHWIGFDCAHSTDYVPSLEMHKKSERFKARIEDNGLAELLEVPKEFKNSALFHPTYKNLSFCMIACMLLIDQIHNVRSRWLENEI